MRLKTAIYGTLAAMVLLAGVTARPTPPANPQLERLLDQTIAHYRLSHPAALTSRLERVLGTVFAQSPTQIQQSASRLDALTRCDSVTGTGAQTLTLQNPGPSASDYIGFVIANGEMSAAITAANPIAVTTTNINGTAPTFGSIQSLAGAQGTVVGPGPIPLAVPLKSNTNTAPTFALSSITNMAWRMTACYYPAT